MKKTPPSQVVLSELSDREQAALLKSIWDSATENSIIATDLASNIIAWNEGAVNFYGYIAAEVLGKNAFILHINDDISSGKAQMIVNEVNENGRWTGEIQRITKTGQVLTVFVAMTLRHNKVGEPIGYTIISRYLTASQEMSSQLTASQEQANILSQTLLEKTAFLEDILKCSTGYSFIAKDLDGTILAWNEGARINYGYEAEEVIGKMNANVLHTSEDIKSGKVGALYRTALNSGSATGEFYRVRKNGEVFLASVSLSLRKAADGSPLGLVVISKDITSEKQLQESLLSKNAELELQKFLLKVSQDRLNRAVFGTKDGLWERDLRTDKIYYSPRLLEMLGYVENDLGSQFETLYSIVHPNDYGNFIKDMSIYLDKDGTVNSEVRLKLKNGTYGWFHVRGQTTYDVKNKPIVMSGFITDISQRKEMEGLKNQFVSNVSHELRTPLTSIKGSLSLVMSGINGDVPEKMASLISIAHKNCDRLILLINDILDMEKIKSGQIQFDSKWATLPAMIRQGIELNTNYAERYKVKFVVKEPLLNIEVYVDSNRLMQVLTNLLSNAVKFSKPNGKVKISTLKVDNFVRVLIRDYGSGIPDHFRSRIFDKFSQAENCYTKEKGGTGLGLYISKSIIENFGGKLGFESRANEGSTFFFDLPTLVKNNGKSPTAE